MNFEVNKIANGWALKGNWIDPGGGDMPPRPRSETLFCRDIHTTALVMEVWANDCFEGAYNFLRAQIQGKEVTK